MPEYETRLTALAHGGGCGCKLSPAVLHELLAGVPAMAAFPEREGPGLLVLRGQGGEEIVFAAIDAPGGSSVRGSSMLFGQQINRFFSTLPPAAQGAA